MATKAEDLRIIRSFAERLDCRVSPIAAEWEVVKGNYNGDVNEYLFELEWNGDYDVFQDNFGREW